MGKRRKGSTSKNHTPLTPQRVLDAFSSIPQQMSERLGGCAARSCQGRTVVRKTQTIYMTCMHVAGPQTLELRMTAGNEMAGLSTLQVPESVLAKQAVHAADYCLVGKPPHGAYNVSLSPTPRSCLSCVHYLLPVMRSQTLPACQRYSDADNMGVASGWLP